MAQGVKVSACACIYINLQVASTGFITISDSTSEWVDVYHSSDEEEEEEEKERAAALGASPSHHDGIVLEDQSKSDKAPVQLYTM